MNPLWWKCGVLTTGPPGKSLREHIIKKRKKKVEIILFKFREKRGECKGEWRRGRERLGDTKGKGSGGGRNWGNKEKVRW